MAQAMRRDIATWAVREQCGRQHEPNKKAPLFFKSAPDHPARASNTARGHRIPPRVS
jgi:hypothetical protein